ncbi:MAG: class I SAM-dependent methyltransferase [Phormidium tanganyikae FI6-MK23]|jgi:SAM-dependent methyltransferase|nr:class I SAM-dependent methyltransferase [Phormidium tanganyikae FI6-MK23]
MKLKRLFAGFVVSLSVASVGIGCTQQRDFQADAQTNPPTSQPQTQAPERAPDVPYVPTPEAVVDRMLQIANVNSNDVVYDLGSGDGRIPIVAVQRYKAQRAVGVDINPERVREANQNAQQANVTDRVEFRQQDLFETDLRNASVVTLYLLPEVNLRLRPKLLSELRPGTRIVSHAFDMGDWKPERVENVDGRTIYYWTVPENVPANLKQ